MAAQIPRWQNLRAQIAACAHNSRLSSSLDAFDLSKCKARDTSKSNASDTSSCSARDPSNCSGPDASSCSGPDTSSCSGPDTSSCSEYKKREENLSLHRKGEWGLGQLLKIHPAFGDKDCWQYSNRNCVHSSSRNCVRNTSRDDRKISKAATKAFQEMSCSLFLTFEQMLRVLQLVEHPAFKERLNLSKVVLEPSGSADNICKVTLALVQREAK